MKLSHAVVMEQTSNNYGTYASDVPGRIGTASGADEMRANILDSLAFHIDGLVRSGDLVPKPAMSIDDAIAHRSQSLRDPEWLSAGGHVMATLSTSLKPVDFDVAGPRVRPPVCALSEIAPTGREPHECGSEAMWCREPVDVRAAISRRFRSSATSQSVPWR